MNSDTINKAYEEIVMGGCVHDLVFAPMSGVRCPRCNKEWNSPEHVYPAHDEDDNVILGAIKELFKNHRQVIITEFVNGDFGVFDEKYRLLSRADTLEHAVMLAVLKMKGWEGDE